MATDRTNDVLQVRSSETADRQFTIENVHSLRMEDWDTHYVSISGYFGVYGPHLFAAAPALLEAARSVLSLIKAIEAYKQEALPQGIALREAIAFAEGGR